MSFSRREEAFRYNFAEPLGGTFQITKIDGVGVESKIGELKILDISLHGAKISTQYDFHIEWKNIELTLQFQVMSISFSIPGILVHHERNIEDDQYGIHLKTDDTIQDQMINELKAYAWSLVREKSI